MEARSSAGRFSRDSENTQPAWQMQIYKAWLVLCVCVLVCAFVWERKFAEKINLHIIINDIYNYNAESAYQGRKCILYLVLGISRLFPLSNFFLSADKSIAKERKASKMLCRQDSNSRPLDQKYNVRRLSHTEYSK